MPDSKPRFNPSAASGPVRTQIPRHMLNEVRVARPARRSVPLVETASGFKSRQPRQGAKAAAVETVGRQTHKAHVGSAVDPAVAKRARRLYRKRLARIVTDQWLFLSRFRFAYIRAREYYSKHALRSGWQHFENQLQCARVTWNAALLAKSHLRYTVRYSAFFEWTQWVRFVLWTYAVCLISNG
jgi:hypothetical protein